MPQRSADTDFDYAGALRGCANGRRDSLQALYRQEGARLLGSVRRIVHDPRLAEDLVHDAFIAIWRQAGQFEPERGSARAWMHAIARHLALDHVRDRARHVVLDADTSGTPAREAALDAWPAAESGTHARPLAQCLGRLAPPERRCLMRAYVEGLSYRELAACLHIPPAQARPWVARSLKALQECLS